MPKNFDRSPKISPEVSISKFKQIMKEIYNEMGLELPDQLYLSDSAVEAELGVPGVRVYGGTSDIDILAAEPEGIDQNQISLLEREIRDSLAESGVDFNFATKDELLSRNAYDRPCRPIKNFSW